MNTAIRPTGPRTFDPLAWLAGVAILFSIARGFYPGWGSPLWFDEAYTATIATQKSFGGLIDWCLHELSGPVYYTLTWVWTQLFGASAAALRMPSLLCAIATPVLINWKGGAARNVLIIWAVLLLLWLPGVTFPSEARPYALLMLLTTGQVILFHQLLTHGGLRRAIGWAVLTAAIILTHYHALIISALQGLLYLALRRHEIRTTWPAALTFVPVAVWIYFHLPFVLAYTSPGVAGNDLLSLADVLRIPTSLVGGNIVAALFMLAMMGSMLVDATRLTRGRDGHWFTAVELATVAASLAGALIVIAIGFAKPTFVMRYLTPFMPGIFFGLAVWTCAVTRRFALLPAALVIAILFGAASDFASRVRHPELDVRYRFNFEHASAWLRTRGIRRLVFFWDNTTATISTGARLGEVGSYFLRQDGWRGPVIVPRLAGKNVDPNIALGAIATTSGDGIIWAYDRLYAGSLGRHTPPRLAAMRDAFDCRNYGLQNYVVMTCIRR